MLVTNGTASDFAPVTRKVTQKLVFSLFEIYVNDIDDGIVSQISKFSDYTKFINNVTSGKIV